MRPNAADPAPQDDAAELLRLLDLLPAPSILAADPAGERVVMNRAFTDMLGLPRVPGGLNERATDRPFSYRRAGRELSADELPLRMAIARGTAVRNVEIEIHTNAKVIHVVGNGAPLRGPDGAITGAVATFTDISEMRRLQAVHEGIRKERDIAAARLNYLAEAGRELSESLDLRAVLDTLGRIVVPRFADCASITAYDDSGRPTIAHVHHKDRAAGAEMQARRETLQGGRPGAFPFIEKMQEQVHAVIVKDIAEFKKLPSSDDGYARYVDDLSERFGFRSALVAPLINRGEPVGTLAAFSQNADAFSADDLRLFEEFGRRAGSAVQNARAFERQRQVAESLQNALLPERLPRTKEVHFDAVYAAADDASQLGGDWYDAFYLAPRCLAVSIGDVTGRGVDAAVLMGKVRQNIRALSLVERDPARLLDATDAAIRRNNPDLIVTAIVGVLDLDAMTFRYASAGHPPPYLRRKTGAVLELPCHGLPLGLRGSAEAATVELQLQPGDLLTLYTDGLTESTHDLSEGERRLRVALEELGDDVAGEAANAIRERVLHDGSRDDVAVLTLHVVESNEGDPDGVTWSFDASNAKLAHLSRSFFLQYLVECGRAGDDFAGAELVFGEMIGNVVRHAPGPVRVTVDWTAEQPVLEVRDQGTGFAAAGDLPADPMSEAGRGIFLIRELTDELDVNRDAQGTHVRATLKLHR